MKISKIYFIWGLVLLVAFFIQDAFEIRWQWLQQLQTDETYKRLSGFILAIYLAEQWYLSLMRIWGQSKKARSNYKLHQQLGVLSPLFFYIHSVRIGYAYLFLLSLVYFSNATVGLFNPVFLEIRHRKFSFYWMIAHVSLSLLTVILMFFHIYIVFYYE